MRRKAFPVTHDLLDAPDGCKMELPERGGWFQRVIDTWEPIERPFICAGIVPNTGLARSPHYFYCTFCNKSWERGGHKEGFVKASASRHVFTCWEIELFRNGYTIGAYTNNGYEAVPLAKSHPRMIRAIKANIRRRTKENVG